MKLIKPNVELVKEANPYKKVELVGRTCYKSEDKITDDSYKIFFKNLVTRRHMAMLEHGVVTFLITGLETLPQTMFQIPYLVITPLGEGYKMNWIISASLSHIYNDWNEALPRDSVTVAILIYMKQLCEQFYQENGTNFIQMFSNLCTMSIVDNLPQIQEQFPESPILEKHQFISMKFTCDRGVSHELVRHRCSVAQSSTRYVSSCARKSLKEYNLDDIEDIKRCYLQGFSSTQIADNSSFESAEICSMLKDSGIKLRGSCMKGYRNDKYFDSIDSANKAYLLGIIQSDGSLNGNTLSITQHSDYVWYIELLLYEFCDAFCRVNDGNCKDLQITSKYIAERLRNIGIVTDKCHKQTDEDIDKLWSSIPDIYKQDFIRGLIDGDGHVGYFIQKYGKTKSPSIGLASTSKHLLDLIAAWIKCKFDYKCGIYQHHETKTPLWDLSISHREKSLEIGKTLYAHFKYPFGHPKKASNWISEFGDLGYEVSEFGDPNFKIVLPSDWSSWDARGKFAFLKLMYDSETTYTNLRVAGYQPQQARAVLPNALMTEVILTMSAKQWAHFLNLRYFGITGNPHPDMKIVAEKAYHIFSDEFDGKFQDTEEASEEVDSTNNQDNK